MLLAVDVGNTNTVFALARGREMVRVWRCRTDPARTADEYMAWLYPLFREAGLEFPEVDSAIVSSVVPDANFSLQRLCRDTFRVEAVFVGKDAVDIRINLRRPEEVGADRLVNAHAAVRDYGAPAIVIDFGTATTFDYVNGKGEYCGGVIAPGINLSVTALHQAAARLPRISLRKPDKVIGDDTVSAMQSGVYWGYVSMVEGMIARMVAECGETPHVVATGGLASLLSASIPAVNNVDKDLTLRGLIYIHEQSAHERSAATKEK